MSFDIVNFALAASVADAATVTVGYPTGRSKGNYALNSGKHKLRIGKNIYSSPADFTIVFNANASSITVTNATGATWPIQSDCAIQLEQAGVNADSPFAVLLASVKRVTALSPVMIDLGSPNVADANGFIVSQDLTALGVFSVSATATAALAAAALAGSADVPRNVVAAWTGTAVLTVTGTDEYGTVIVESSASGTTLTGDKAFKTITDITTSADITSLTVGTGDVLGLPVAVNNTSVILAEMKDGVTVGRGPNGKIRLYWNAEQVSVLAGTTHAIELISPVVGAISGLTVATRAAVTTGDAVTVAVATTAVDGLSVAVADSSTKGTTTSDTPTAGHATTVVAKGDRLQIIFGNLFATAGALDGYLEITPTDGVSDGGLVLAVGTEATALTGDVRGTYDPADACDGDAGYRLAVLLADPNDLGIAQFGG